MKFFNNILTISLLATQSCICANDNMLSTNAIWNKTTNYFQKYALRNSNMNQLIQENTITLAQFTQLNNCYQQSVLENSNMTQLLQDQTITWDQFMQIDNQWHTNAFAYASQLLQNNTITWDQFIQIESPFQQYALEISNKAKLLQNGTITLIQILQIDNGYQARALKHEILTNAIKNCSNIFTDLLWVDSTEKQNMLTKNETIEILQNVDTTLQEICHIEDCLKNGNISDIKVDDLPVIEKFSEIPDNQVSSIDNIYQVYALKRIHDYHMDSLANGSISWSDIVEINDMAKFLLFFEF